MNTPGGISTPRNKCRHLGLRRTIERPKAQKTPLSDLKINYKSLQKNDDSSPLPPNTTNNPPVTSSPSTPFLLKNKLNSAYTVNSLPSRLSLGNRVREKYRKKKLEFTAPKTEAEHDAPPSTSHNSHNDASSSTNDSRNKMTSHEKHQEKVNELTALIETWKGAFKASLEELSSKIEPRMDTEDLLARLGIDPEMIEYT